MEGVLLPTGRRSGPRRDERADVRRPAQSRDAGGVSGRDSGEVGLDARQGLPLGVKPIRVRNGIAGYGADSGPSRGDPCWPAIRPIWDVQGCDPERVLYVDSSRSASKNFLCKTLHHDLRAISGLAGKRDREASRSERHSGSRDFVTL